MIETAVEPDEGEPYPTSLPGLALLFLRLGSTSFGGPAAHIAMMEDEVVRRRRWMTHEEFLDLLGGRYGRLDARLSNQKHSLQLGLLV